MDLNKLSTGEKVIAGTGLLFLVSMFLPWWGISTEFGSGHNNGFDYFLTGWLPLLIIIAMVAQIALVRFSSTQLPTIPIPWNQAHLIAGAVVAVLLVLRTIIGSSEGSGLFEVDLDRQWGLFVALIAAIGVGVGGFLKSREPEVVQAVAAPEGSGPPANGPGAPPPPGGGTPPPPPGGSAPPPPPGGQTS